MCELIRIKSVYDVYVVKITKYETFLKGDVKKSE